MLTEHGILVLTNHDTLVSTITNKQNERLFLCYNKSMNTRNLKCFQTVYEERNLQIAAGKLFLSPQGLSKIIKSLEDECGAALFVRSKEGFVPTESGKVFYEKSKVIVQSLNDMFQSIESIGDKEKRFKVGFAAGTIRAIDIPKVKSFMEENPEILGSWSEYENAKVIDQVLNDEISFGFVVGKPAQSNITATLVQSLDLVVYIHKMHKFWDKNTLEIKELRDENLILMNEKHHLYYDVVNACHMCDFKPHIAATVEEGEAMYKLVENGIGIGISPRFLKDNDNIRAVSLKDAYTWDIYGIYRKDSADKDIAERFLTALKS